MKLKRFEGNPILAPNPAECVGIHRDHQPRRVV